MKIPSEFIKGFLLGLTASAVYGLYKEARKYRSTYVEKGFGSDPEMVAKDINTAFKQYTKNIICNDQQTTFH